MSCSRRDPAGLVSGGRDGNNLRAHVAQLVEHVLGKDEVSGSIPLVGSSLRRSHAEAKAATPESRGSGRRRAGLIGYGLAGRESDFDVR